MDCVILVENKPVSTSGTPPTKYTLKIVKDGCGCACSECNLKKLNVQKVSAAHTSGSFDSDDTNVLIEACDAEFQELVKRLGEAVGDEKIEITFTCSGSNPTELRSMKSSVQRNHFTVIEAELTQLVENIENIATSNTAVLDELRSFRVEAFQRLDHDKQLLKNELRDARLEISQLLQLIASKLPGPLPGGARALPPSGPVEPY